MNKITTRRIEYPEMKKDNLNKSAVLTLTEELDYVSDAIQVKSILNKITGQINAVSFDSGTTWEEKTSPFDTYIQVIEGRAEIIIADQTHHLNAGQSIIIPAHAPHRMEANERFKMISTTIKSGYEEVVL